ATVNVWRYVLPGARSPEWKALAPGGIETFSFVFAFEGSAVTVWTPFDEFFHVIDSPVLIVTSRGENWCMVVISTVRPPLESSPDISLRSPLLLPHAPIIAVRATNAARAPRCRMDFAICLSSKQNRVPL